MRKPGSVRSLEDLGRVRLSKSFFMRDMLYSEIANYHGIPNIPHYPDIAIEAGKQISEQLLEPLQHTFGRIAIRSAYRSPEVNQYGNEHNLSCASNEANYGRYIWDYRDCDGHLGATVCIAVPWFIEKYENGADWRSLAWWIHDHLPYSQIVFFPKLAAFNLTWSEAPKKVIKSFIDPKGILTSPELEQSGGGHKKFYEGFPSL